MFRRREVFYCEDTATGKQTSLRTKDENEAQTLLHTKNEAVRQPAMNLQIAQVYLQHADAGLAGRTCQGVMDAMLPLKTGPTQSRWKSAMRDKAFDPIRRRKLIETTGELVESAKRDKAHLLSLSPRRFEEFIVSWCDQKRTGVCGQKRNNGLAPLSEGF